ncbi:MAG: AMP-binding protein [Methylococcaceae bacterium]|nr:AMP-binding protein [Methylococcaceae bacterium]
MSLVSGFIQQSHRSPNTIAFTEGDKQLSYAQFLSNSQCLASAIQQRLYVNQLEYSDEPPRIALLLDRGITAAVAIYGILMAGATYVPLDIHNPPSRLNFIIQDAQPLLILGLGTCPAWLETPEQWLNIEQLPQALPYIAPAIDLSALAAILYTSGSTGSPKGVALSHQAMLNFSVWAADTFAIEADDRIASLAPLHFDLSVFDLFSSLSKGASVHFMPTSLSFSPSRLTAWLNEQAISCWYTVPSILSFIALKGALSTTPLHRLKTLLFAGEVFPTPQLISLAEQLPQVNLYNLYGPTETNVCCYWRVERTRLKPNEAIPIGISAGNASLKIAAETGELWVQSANNFAGYWQNGTLNAPIAADNWHATGDKVSINQQGEYCYHGRLDRMLKCSGYRIEPAEIEHAINQLPGVENCAVVGIGDGNSGQRPAAAVVLNANYTLADIIQPLKETLPAYMLPGKFLILEKLPTLSNGKIDFPALQQLLT